MEDIKEIIINDSIDMAYSRTGYSKLVKNEDGIWCIEMDSSEGEYGAISVPVKDILSILEKHGQTA